MNSRLPIASAYRFADESFDVAYSNGVLHHTPDTAGAVREIHRVLKPGGQARVMLYHRGSWAYWSQVVLRYGILRGEFLRGTSANDIMSRYVEFNAGGGRPLVKAYSRREARSLFSNFSRVEITIEQLMRSEFYFLGRLIPENISCPSQNSRLECDHFRAKVTLRDSADPLTNLSTSDVYERAG